jgi:hypothetical protein
VFFHKSNESLIVERKVSLVPLTHQRQNAVPTHDIADITASTSVHSTQQADHRGFCIGTNIWQASVSRQIKHPWSCKLILDKIRKTDLHKERSITWVPLVTFLIAHVCAQGRKIYNTETACSPFDIYIPLISQYEESLGNI